MLGGGVPVSASAIGSPLFPHCSVRTLIAERAERAPQGEVRLWVPVRHEADLDNWDVRCMEGVGGMKGA